MKYDFDTPWDRRGTRSLKWDVSEGELPMWVADMDFKTAPQITEMLCRRAAEGIFGYSIITDQWRGAYVNWWKRRHGFELRPEWLIFATGVVPIISSVVRKLTTLAENVLVQTPTYNIFFNSIINNGRNAVESPLKYEGGEYSVDFEDLERKLADSQTTMMILCNPQNPVGKLWDRGTLQRIGELCAEYNVIVVADEIHCDITEPERGYVPFVSVSDVCRDNCIMCAAPTKTFNIAGIQSAAAIVPNRFLRHRVWRALNTDEAAEPNVFAALAAETAYNYGEDWLDELRIYLSENRKTVGEYIAKNIPEIALVPSEATYLLWLDCGGVADNSEKLAKEIRRTTGLYLSHGGEYHASGTFLRMNIACPKSRLIDGLDRLRRGIAAWRAEGGLI